MSLIARSAGRLLLGSGLAISLARCGSDTTPSAAKATCSIDSECTDPLVCRFASCHSACKTTKDCPNKTDHCIKSGNAGVCQTDEERHDGCTYSSECPEGLKCAVDQVCRVPCLADGDCLPQQSCVSHVCADSTELDQRTHDLAHTNPVGGWNGTTDDGGVEGIPEGGMGGRKDSGTKPPPKPSSDGGTPPGKMDGSPEGATGEPEAGGGETPEAGSGPSCTGSGFVGFQASNLPESLEAPSGVMDFTFNRATCFFDTDNVDAHDATVKLPHWDNNWCNPGFGAETQAKVVKLSDGRDAAVLFASSFSIPAGVKLPLTGQRPLILVVSGDVVINGTISAQASGNSGWYAGGAPGPGTPSRDGICPLDMVFGGGRKSSGVSPIGAGGGGFCGPGGNGSPDSTMKNAPAGGTVYGDASLIPLVGGSSGGTGTRADAAAHGGGAIQIVAGGSILIGETGVIDMGGGGGHGEEVGGGSGGAILLEAPSVMVKGVLAANGGGGGAWDGYGQDASPNDQPALGGKITSATDAPRGGQGSAGDEPKGANSDNAVDPAGAGGGGAAGRIRINTVCGGKLTIASSAVISPNKASMCFTTQTFQ